MYYDEYYEPGFPLYDEDKYTHCYDCGALLLLEPGETPYDIIFCDLCLDDREFYDYYQ